MKKLYTLILFVEIGSACQQQHTPSAKAAPVVKTALTVAQVAPQPTQQVVSNSEKPEMVPASAIESTAGPTLATVLQRYDLSALWQGKYDEEVKEVRPLDGFFGHDYRRIALAFTEVHRDSLRPNLYRVKGKSRFQKTVSSFEGTIAIKSVAHPKPGMTLEEVGLLDVENLRSVFTAKATFDFREQPESNTTGIFTGTGYLDFVIDGEGKMSSAISVMNVSPAVPAKGAGVLFTGQWVSYSSGASKPLLLSGNVFITAPVALTHFSIGDRDPVFNPKYAKLGWNDYWANDEWWANSPKPSLGL